MGRVGGRGGWGEIERRVKRREGNGEGKGRGKEVRGKEWGRDRRRINHKVHLIKLYIFACIQLLYLVTTRKYCKMHIECETCRDAGVTGVPSAFRLHKDICISMLNYSPVPILYCWGTEEEAGEREREDNDYEGVKERG